MFFFFPYGADVSLYYRPWATVGLILLTVVVSVVAFFPQGPGDSLTLHFGDGLHPLQWLTASLVHVGPIKLAANMLFLWPFGLVVEGKIGWWRFLLVYLGITTLVNCVFQLALLGTSLDPVQGSSTAVYVLIGIALIWAPRNDLDVFYFVMLFFRIYSGTTEIAIMFVAMFYIGLTLILAIVTGFQVALPLMDLSGAVLGVIVGLVMLKMNLVDCENWDIFAVLADRAGEEAPETQAATISAEELAERTRARHAAALEHIREMLRNENPEAARALDEKMHRQSSEWALPKREHKELVRQLHAHGIWEPSLPLMVDYLRRYPDDSTRMRMRLAQVLITKVERPAQGIRVLKKIPVGALDDQLEAARRKLLRQAKILREEGVMELETEDW